MNNYQEKVNWNFKELKRINVAEATDLVVSLMTGDNGASMLFINKQNSEKAKKQFKSHGVAISKEVAKELGQWLIQNSQ